MTENVESELLRVALDWTDGEPVDLKSPPRYVPDDVAALWDRFPRSAQLALFITSGHAEIAMGYADDLREL